MKRSKLFLLLGSFSRKEWRMFERFVASPYYNLRQDVKDLLAYLQECLLDFHIEPTKEKAFKRLYKEEAYDDHKMRVAISNLFKLAEQFIICESTQEERNQSIRLAKWYREKDLEKLFAQALKKAEAQQESSPFLDEVYFQDNFKLEKEVYSSLALKKRSDELNFESIFSALDRAYFIHKLKEACFAKAHEQVYKRTYSYGLIEPILRYIEEEQLLSIPSIAIYYHCYYTLSDSSNIEHFQSLKKLLFGIDELLTTAEIRHLYLLATNFCLRQYNAGNTTFISDLLDIYEEGLQKAYLLIDGKISRFTYRNLVTIGLIQKRYQWVKSFIYDYKEKLEERYRESMFGLCEARLAFSQGDFTKALDLLQKADYEDILLNLAAKTVLMKVYYAMNEYDLLESHLSAMQVYIRRKKIMGYHRDNYLNMSKYMRKVLELVPSDQEAKKQLREEIQSSKTMVEKEWLLKCLT
ncbi:MAG: hypothetical protein MK226_02555 [Saprospiraceae bacterium]|nr:hypothetical protein [Saprospiraceae bacterium]